MFFNAVFIRGFICFLLLEIPVRKIAHYVFLYVCNVISVSVTFIYTSTILQCSFFGTVSKVAIMLSLYLFSVY